MEDGWADCEEGFLVGERAGGAVADAVEDLGGHLGVLVRPGSRR